MSLFTMGGTPVHLMGTPLRVGQRAPKFKLIGQEFNELTNDLFYGKVVVLSCIPSIDTPVCSLQTRRFHEELLALSPDITLITVSKDLPFAQSRWCAAEGINRVIMASDYRNFGFAKDYGVLIEEMGLLTRAVFILDKRGIVVYTQYVPEIGQEPDYAPVLETVKKYI